MVSNAKQNARVADYEPLLPKRGGEVTLTLQVEAWGENDMVRSSGLGLFKAIKIEVSAHQLFRFG